MLCPVCRGALRFNKKGALSCDICGYERQMPKHKPMTNADRIRAMTDEELSHFFASFYEKLFRCPEEDWEKADCLKRPCDSCWLDWLKQEADT